MKNVLLKRCIYVYSIHVQTCYVGVCKAIIYNKCCMHFKRYGAVLSVKTFAFITEVPTLIIACFSTKINNLFEFMLMKFLSNLSIVVK